jgi:hypothetical protein
MNAHTRPAAPNMHNYTNDYLADEIGALTEEARGINTRLNAYKAEAKRRGIEIAQGSHYRITITTVESKHLDTDALRTLLGDALDPYYKTRFSQRLLPSALFQQPEVVG